MKEFPCFLIKKNEIVSSRQENWQSRLDIMSSFQPTEASKSVAKVQRIKVKRRKEVLFLFSKWKFLCGRAAITFQGDDGRVTTLAATQRGECAQLISPWKRKRLNGRKK